MAARDYYNSSYPSGYHANPDRRTDGPLPSLPTPSPPSFGNGNGRMPSSYPHSSETSYSSSAYQKPYPGHRDPVDDDGAVPLRPYNHQRDSQSSLAPIMSHHDDPLVRDAKSGRKKNYPQDLPPPPAAEQGWFKGRITWCCYLFSLVQIAVFIAELARNGALTGTPIEIKPTFNPMIGPSPYVLINMGARYQPCMHKLPNVNNTISWPCPNATSTTGSSTTCTLAQLCGFNGQNIPQDYGKPGDAEPNQWFRFITPIFLHAGFIHIGFNLLLQLTLGRDMELAIGSLRFALVYFSAGIFGFVLGGNFAANGIASTGASGSLFGVLALNLLDLLYHWQTRRSPMRDLIFILIDVGISFVLGLLPGLDNFSHIGGFLMGLVLGVCLLRSPPALSRRLGEDEPSYGLMAPATERGGIVGFARGPIGFFKGRKPLWWVWWLVRVGALIGTIIGFIVLLKNFYVWHRTCSWCKHLTCINISNWCDAGNLNITTNPAKRAVDVLMKRKLA